MSDTNQGNATSEGGGDNITNVKAEFNRKLGNFENKIASLESTNAQLLAAVQAMAKPSAPAQPNKKIEDVWFDKPQEAAESIVSEAEKRIMTKIDNRNSQLAKQNATLSQLVSDFPELSDGSHDLTKKAVEIYSGMSEDEKTSPLAYKAAVKEAALELGIMPKAKRKETYEEDFSIGGSGSSQYRSESNRQRRGEVDSATAEFARLVGVNIDDPKVKERIKSKHSRRSYNNWE